LSAGEKSGRHGRLRWKFNWKVGIRDGVRCIGTASEGSGIEKSNLATGREKVDVESWEKRGSRRSHKNEKQEAHASEGENPGKRKIYQGSVSYAKITKSME